MMCVIHCIRQHLTFSFLDTLGNFLQTVCYDSLVAKEMQCKRNKATALVRDVIGPYSSQQLTSLMKYNVFSLIIDETTDVSVHKSLVMVIRLFDKKVEKINDYFLALIELENADASGIFEAITNKLKQHDVPIKNLVGLSTDNASVMSGCINGVKTKLRNLNETFFYIGCTCHKIHLAASAATKTLPTFLEKNIRKLINPFCSQSKKTNRFSRFSGIF